MTPARAKAKGHMLFLIADEPGATATELAEFAADMLGHHEWLDDPVHWIWDVAMGLWSECNE